ncbi:MAG: hypothetical protein H6860_03205 [Rhodospirillales bacterium]|nr:hypothetical protein [Rhodospirillales bacterium]
MSGIKVLRSINIRHILLAGFILPLALAPTLYAQETSADFSGGSIKIGYDNQTCNASLEGAIRYDSSSNALEYCTGSAWQAMGG